MGFGVLKGISVKIESVVKISGTSQVDKASITPKVLEVYVSDPSTTLLIDGNSPQSRWLPHLSCVELIWC